MTERLYYTDSYLHDFTARIVDRADDGTRVYLDATAFYPTSGGQPHDLGTIGGVAIADVVDEGERVAHVLASVLEQGSAELSCVVDWTRRFDHMQQHTGQHLVSAVFEDLFGYKTVSVHFGPDYSTLDLDAESVSRQQILAAEGRANALVIENRPVLVTFEDASAAAGLRKASDREGTLRIISIDGIDRSACGGTHVRATGEIGPVLIRSIEKMRKSTRVEFLCGHRAVRRARRDYETLASIAGSLSAAIDDAGALVAGQSERLREADGIRRKLEKELATFRARELWNAASENANGVRTIRLPKDAASMDELKTIAQAAMSLPKCVAIGTLASPASVLFATSEDSGVDAGRTLKDALAAVGGRGGGSPRLAQGSVPDTAAAEQVVTALAR